jgi:hypothetical protein
MANKFNQVCSGGVFISKTLAYGALIKLWAVNRLALIAFGGAGA